MLLCGLITLLEVVLVYATPICRSLQSLSSTAEESNKKEKWIAHWLTVALAHASLYPIINSIETEMVNFVLRLVLIAGIFLAHKWVYGFTADGGETLKIYASQLANLALSVVEGLKQKAVEASKKK